MTDYNKDSIVHLSPRDAIRTRPDLYLSGMETPIQLLKEVVTNCCDEFLAGNCNEVHIDFDKNKNEYIVEDNGRGIPIENVDDKTVLEIAFSELHTSGKYSHEENDAYKISTGSFGAGSKATNFVSKIFEVTSYRQGKSESILFKDGIFQSREYKNNSNKHGLKVRFIPDESFFQNKYIKIEELKQELLYLTCVCKGLKIYYNDELFYHPNGLIDLIPSENVITSSFSFSQEENKKQIDFVMQYSSLSSNTFFSFCNYGLIESGTHLTAIKSCLTRTLNKWGKDNGFIKNEKLTGANLQEGIYVCFNVVSTNIRYNSQVKNITTNTDDNSFINAAIGSHLEAWLDSHPDDGKTIIERAVLAKKASEAAKRARANVKAKKQKEKIAKILHPDKLKDAEFLGEESTLLIVEGE